MSTQTRIEVLERIALHAIRPASDNVRTDLGELAPLAASIKANGILEPLILRELGPGEYEIVAGHRRHAAALLAGETTAPCMVRDFPDDTARIVAMVVENLQRTELSPLDEAEGYRRLLALGLTQESVAAQVGFTQQHVSNRVALLDLPPVVRERIHNGVVTLTTARELTKLRDTPEVIEQLVADIFDEQRQPAEGEDDWRDQDLRERAEDVVSERERAAKRAAARAQLEADGIALAHEKQRYRYLDDADIEAHRSETCFGATIGRLGDIDFVCLEPSKHETATDGAPARERTPADGETATLKHDLKAAATERRLHLGRLLKKPPKDALTFAAIGALYGADLYTVQRVAELSGLAPEGSGTRDDYLELLVEAARKDPLRMLLAIAFAAAEPKLDVTPWSLTRGWDDGALLRGYYAFLEEHGYAPAEAEKQMLAKGRGASA